MEKKKFNKDYWRAGNMLYPIPAVMVSCGIPGEKPNIITVAWTGTVCSDPAMVYISVRPERYSYDIIKKTGEFVINLTTERLAKITDLCGVRSGRDIDKFREYGLTAVKSKHVNRREPCKYRMQGKAGDPSGFARYVHSGSARRHCRCRLYG